MFLHSGLTMGSSVSVFFQHDHVGGVISREVFLLSLGLLASSGFEVSAWCGSPVSFLGL